MRLETTIKPRRDGCVIGRLPDLTSYIFTPGEDGVLSCEVADEKHIAWLVNTGHFYPSEPSDFDAVAKLVNEATGNDDDDGDDDLSAAPVEVTHQAAAPGKKGRTRSGDKQ